MPIQEQLIREELANNMEKLPLPILKMFSAAVKEFLTQMEDSDKDRAPKVMTVILQSVSRCLAVRRARCGWLMILMSL